MGDETEICATYHTVTPDADGRRVLLLPVGVEWTLPRLETAEDHFGVVNHLNEWMEQQFGLSTTVLRCLRFREECVKYHVHALYALENHGAVAGGLLRGQWFGKDEVAGLSLADPTHQEVLEEWFRDAVGKEISPLRPPWAQAGWYDEAVAWIEASLAQRGYRQAGPVEQVRCWQRCCLLRIPTTAGDVYFKALPQMFAHEPALLASLAARHPQQVPVPLALDPDRRWMLMADIGGLPIHDVPEVTRWEEAVRAYGRIQIDYASRVGELLALGSPDRRLAAMSAWIDPLLSDTAALQPGFPNDLTEAEIQTFRELAPALKAACEALRGFAVPETLEHGDFCTGNIQITERGPVIFDWSDSCVAHPFFSLGWLFTMLEWVFPGESGVRARLRDAYLEPWTVYEPLNRLRQAYALAEPLGFLHLALHYHRFLLPSVEVSWDMPRLIPRFLRLCLKSWEACQAET